MKKSSWFALAAALAACGMEGEFEPETSTKEAEIGTGPNSPGNSPILAALNPFEASVLGLREPRRRWKLYPGSFRKHGEPITDFRVVGAQPAGTLNGVAMTPADFGEVTFRMNYADQEDYEFKIERDSHIPVLYYSNPGKPLPPISAYHLVYRAVPMGEPCSGPPTCVDVWKDVCPYTATPDEGLEANDVVFWTGDRYDPVTAKIYASDDQVGSWFNMSCAGEAGIKMLRTGTGGAVDPSTSRELRQTVLNMFIAKYCPSSNKRFTQLGVPLFWKGTAATLHKWFEQPEAIWNAGGAVCLTRPRLWWNTTESVNDECGLAPPRDIPDCPADWFDNYLEHGLVRTSVSPLFFPPPPP